MKKSSNEFEPFLNECQTYVWEWYIPEHKVRFGIPSLNRLWIDDKEKNIKLSTMLERVHPDDIEKVLVRKTSPLFRSDKMFEVDLRLNVADVLMPDGTQSSGKYEWYGFRGKTILRDAKGQPTYVRGVAINLDQRYRAQMKLIAQKEHQIQSFRQQNEYCFGVMQEVYSFMRGLAKHVNALIPIEAANAERMAKINELQTQAERILSLSDKYRNSVGEQGNFEEDEIKPLFLWEHLVELQQVYSLKATSVKVSFSNQYDNNTIYVNVKLLDLLIDNIVNIEQRNKKGSSITLSYVANAASNRLQLSVTCSNASSEGGMSLGVCQILAKRLWGDVVMQKKADGIVEYLVTIPYNALNTLSAISAMPEQDTLDELTEQQSQENAESQNLTGPLPHILLGLHEGSERFDDLHLFKATICESTDSLLRAFDKTNPELVFIDSRLDGVISLDDTISSMHEQYPETPIIVSADEAQRSLHKHLCQLGARYLLTNPITLRKVNMMVKRYLK